MEWGIPDFRPFLPVDVAATRSGPEAFDRSSTAVGLSFNFPSDLRCRRGCLLLLKEDVLGLEGMHPIVSPFLRLKGVQEEAVVQVPRNEAK